MSGIQYRVNIYAVVDRSSEDLEILESKELHEKIIQVIFYPYLKTVFDITYFFLELSYKTSKEIKLQEECFLRN